MTSLAPHLLRHIIGVAVTIFCFSSAHAQTLTSAGYGDIKFGDSLAAAEMALGESVDPLASALKPACDYVRFKKYPGIMFMVNGSTIKRADVRTPAIVKNEANIRVGTSVSAVVQRFLEKHDFLKLEISPHKYDEQGHYLALVNIKNKSALQFGVHNGKITGEIQAGLDPEVYLVEGCS